MSLKSCDVSVEFVLQSEVRHHIHLMHRLFILVHIDLQTRFVSCSATIANPLTHMVNIFGLDAGQIQVVTEDGAPTGLKEFLIWRSPYVDDLSPELGRQASMMQATALMRFLMKRGIRVILFCKVDLVLAQRTEMLVRLIFSFCRSGKCVS